MPDTKIIKTPDGWIDVDMPGVTFSVRWKAREARRNRLASPTVSTMGQKTVLLDRFCGPRPSQSGLAKIVTASGAFSTPKATITFGSYPLGNGPSVSDGQVQSTTLDSLQMRAYTRLTDDFGVSNDDALKIVTNHGYNAAVSYGHMRLAGANHSEASLVIGLNDPEISLSYGLARGRGMTHSSALSKALTENDG